MLMIDMETLVQFGLKPGDVREQVTTSGFDVGRWSLDSRSHLAPRSS